MISTTGHSRIPSSLPYRLSPGGSNRSYRACLTSLIALVVTNTSLAAQVTTNTSLAAQVTTNTSLAAQVTTNTSLAAYVTQIVSSVETCQ